MADRKRIWLASALLMVSVLIAVLQGQQVLSRIAHQAVAKVWVNRSLDAILRGADSAYGESFMQDVDAMRTEIPEDARVVLLLHSGLHQFDSVYFMQYFLFPREILTCGDETIEDCLVTMSDETTYFLDASGHTGEMEHSLTSCVLRDGLTLLSVNACRSVP